MQNAVFGVNEATGRRVFRLKKPKRQGDGARVNGFGIIITETRGACVIARNRLSRYGLESGPQPKESLEDNLRIGPCASVSGPELARVSRYSNLNQV